MADGCGRVTAGRTRECVRDSQYLEQAGDRAVLPVRAVQAVEADVGALQLGGEVRAGSVRAEPVDQPDVGVRLAQDVVDGLPTLQRQLALLVRSARQHDDVPRLPLVRRRQVLIIATEP